jgi:hypothetical protein
VGLFILTGCVDVRQIVGRLHLFLRDFIFDCFVGLCLDDFINKLAALHKVIFLVDLFLL